MNVRDISVVITSRNDAGTIHRCLESVRGFGETVLVDAFSEDETVDIARRFPVSIYRRAVRSGADQKNWAVSRATHRRVLALSANEVVTASLQEQIERADGEGAQGFAMRRETEYLGRRMRSAAASGWETIRLFDRERGKFVQNGPAVEVELVGEHARMARLEGAVRDIGLRDVHGHFERINLETTVEAAIAVGGGGGRLALLGMWVGPPFRFFHLYFLRGGLRDGARGLIYCLMSAYAAFIGHAKAWEYRRRGRKRGDRA